MKQYFIIEIFSKHFMDDLLKNKTDIFMMGSFSFISNDVSLLFNITINRWTLRGKKLHVSLINLKNKCKKKQTNTTSIHFKLQLAQIRSIATTYQPHRSVSTSRFPDTIRTHFMCQYVQS